MANIGQTTLELIRSPARLLEAEKLIGIFQGRISIMVERQNALLTDRIHDCSRPLCINYFPFKRALTQRVGPYM